MCMERGQPQLPPALCMGSATTGPVPAASAALLSLGAIYSFGGVPPSDPARVGDLASWAKVVQYTRELSCLHWNSFSFLTIQILAIRIGKNIPLLSAGRQPQYISCCSLLAMPENALWYLCPWKTFVILSETISYCYYSLLSKYPVGGFLEKAFFITTSLPLVLLAPVLTYQKLAPVTKSTVAVTIQCPPMGRPWNSLSRVCVFVIGKESLP